VEAKIRGLRNWREVIIRGGTIMEEASPSHSLRVPVNRNLRL